MKESEQKLVKVAEEALKAATSGFANAQRQAEELRKENVRLKENIMLIEQNAKIATTLAKKNEQLKADLGEFKIRATLAEESLLVKNAAGTQSFEYEMNYFGKTKVK